MPGNAGRGLGKGTRMDKHLIAELARRAGLDRALAEFPDDVAAAAAQADALGATIGAPSDHVAEPWPPMRTAPR